MEVRVVPFNSFVRNVGQSRPSFLSELLGVSDATVYRYNAELRKLVKGLGLSHIRFVRIQDLLPIAATKTFRTDVQTHPPMGDLSECDYVANAPETRRAFLSVDIGNFNPDHDIKSDEGILRTYQGYLRFLKLDLEESQMFIKPKGSHVSGNDSPARVSRRERERITSRIAKQMMNNGAVCFALFPIKKTSFMFCSLFDTLDHPQQRFSALVECSFPNAVRLSIHPHTNAGPKFALRVFPRLEIACTPVSILRTFQ